MNSVLMAVAVLALLGLVFAFVLYFVAQRFKSEESPMVDEIEAVLPGANCGGCGKAGCHAMAEAFVRQGNMEGLRCGVGGDEVAAKVAAILGCEVVESVPMVAVVRCSACFGGSQQRNIYDGHRDCGYAAGLYSGENECLFGCVGLGNCAKVCQFGALRMDAATHAPVVDASRCVACGACVKACPRHIIELRPKEPRAYVKCMNKEKGAEAHKTCASACIGCGKCVRTCPHGAVKVENNLAYIDASLCQACGQCVAECPIGCIRLEKK